MDSMDSLSSAEFTASDRLKIGHYQEALEAEQSALKIAEERFGPTHPSLAPILEDLATLDRYLALYPEAESNLQWALAIREKYFGNDDPSTAESLAQLASLYWDWGHWEDAEFFQKKAVRILEKGSPADPTRLAPALELLGKIELALQKEGALDLIKKSADLEEKDPSLQPQQQMESLNLQAAAYRMLDKPVEEGVRLEKALDFAQNHFKPNSFEVASAMEQLADFDRSQKRESDAQSLDHSALKIAQGCVGTYFGYSSLPYVCLLAKVEEKLGLWNEAENYLQKALQTSKDSFGGNHPRVAVALLDLAQAEQGLGQMDKAKVDLQQALEIAKSFYRDDNPLVVQIQTQLGR